MDMWNPLKTLYLRIVPSKTVMTDDLYQRNLKKERHLVTTPNNSEKVKGKRDRTYLKKIHKKAQYLIMVKCWWTQSFSLPSIFFHCINSLSVRAPPFHPSIYTPCTAFVFFSRQLCIIRKYEKCKTGKFRFI